MENPFSSKEIWMGYWAWPRAQRDSVPSFDDSLRNSLLEDPFNFSTFFQSLGIVICMLDESFAEQTSTPLLDKINASGTSYNGGDNVPTGPSSLAERMLEALSLFKDSSIGHGLPLDLPGRVFISKIPEWTSSVIYYSKPEYLQAKHASDHEVRGSFALIFDPDDMSCCAVLELVSVKEKPYFNSKMKMFSFALLYTILQKLLFSCIFR
ncbi:hypothetical protein NC652_037500 [Populus alba x Populus x berolinensis]|nr:hypothetical protein NC652_037500 [Populus alba x Populus x berolinensis]